MTRAVAHPAEHFTREYLSGQMTLAEIGRAVGQSRERVRQVFEEAGLPSGRELQRWRRQAKRLAHAVAVAARYEQTHAHGTSRRYSLGCKCDTCREGNARRCLNTRRENGASRGYICAICDEPVWETGQSWRHYKRTDHYPFPIHYRTRRKATA